MAGVIVVGSSGFIGGHVFAALLKAGIGATATDRAEFDLSRQGPDALAKKLAGAEVVVNCVGLARDARVDNLESVNVEGARRLAEACKLAGVKRLIHISTLGADVADASRFQRAKGEGEAALAAIQGLEIVIVRPSLVIGPGGASGDFFSALAALPFPPRLASGAWRVQPLHIDELAELVARLTTTVNPPKIIDAVGPAAMTTDDLTRTLRNWLGLEARPFVGLSKGALGLLAWLNEVFEIGPGDREFVSLLERGNVADPAGVTAALGRPPTDLAHSLALTPSTLADFWRARLYFLQPLLRLSLAALWFGTGFVSFGLFPPSEFYVMLGELGLSGPAAEVALFSVAGANVVLGILLMVKWRTSLVAKAMLALVVLFSCAALLLPHEYWLTPFAPILKNLPIGVALLALIGMERAKR